MHIRIIKAILGEHISLQSVNQIGGRDRVIEACRLDQAVDERKRLYIIDGDFDILMGRRKPALRFLYRLRANCIENLVLHSAAVIDLGMEWMPNQNRNVVDERMSYSVAIDRVVKALRNLTIVYAVAQLLAPELKTSGYSFGQLCEQTNYGLEPSGGKIRARMRYLVREIAGRTNLSTFQRTRRFVEENQIKCGLSWDKLLPGKSMLVPYIYHRACAIFKCRLSLDQFKVRLAGSYDPSSERLLARRLRALTVT